MLPGVRPRFFFTTGVRLLALLPAGVALLLTLPLAPLDGLLTLLDPRAALPGELALESGELTLLLGVELLSFCLFFREVLGVVSSSSSSNFGGKDFFLELRVDIF